MKKLVNILTKNEDFLKSFSSENFSPPIWIMRQAGRYLPEYLQTRSQIDNFLDLCYNPKLACEVTLQPITRFDFDAAIIFSDILVIPDALGQKVEFVKNHGPKLAEFDLKTDLSKLKTHDFLLKLNSVFEAISLTKSKLSKDKTLIGFCGAPWTLACYMINQAGSKNFEKTQSASLSQEAEFSKLIEILTESLILYLSKQIEAGCDVVKIFDSWAGILPPFQLQKWVFEPAKKIIEALKIRHPDVPVICFPRGIGVNYQTFAKIVQPSGLAIDQTIPAKWAKTHLQDEIDVVIQGNLDNFLLAFGSKEQIVSETRKILETYNNKPFIFNLGHGILPQTPITNVELLLETIRNFHH